jgi:putative NADH-flavin reductase
MTITLLGATGFVGSAILKEALDRGHAITAIVRDPAKVTQHDRLAVKVGDIYDAHGLAALIKGNEAVISAFNPGLKDPNLYDDQVRGTSTIIAAFKEAAVRRVLWVGGAGGLEDGSGKRLVDGVNFPKAIKAGSLATINALEQLQAEPELDWSYLSPSAEMKPGLRTGKFRLGKERLLVDSNGKSSISVQDFAMAMIDELENPAHIRQRFTVGY